MIRVILEYILPVLVPFAAYFGWMRLAGRKKGWREAPWFWLIAISIALLVASLVYVAFSAGEKPNGVYHPPVLKDGKIVPGHIERAPGK
jgi:uncharacterized membrane protein